MTPPPFIIMRIQGRRRRVKPGDLWKVSNYMGSLTWLVVEVKTDPEPQARFILTKIEPDPAYKHIDKPNIGLERWLSISESPGVNDPKMTLVARA